MEAMNFDSGGAGTYEAPWLVKLILQSTAVDLGYDPATQGFGRIDAEAAIDFWASGYIGGTLDSALNYVDLIGDAWAYWGILPSSYVPVEVNSTTTAFPAENYDGAVFFGQVMPGETVYINYTVWDENLDVVTADWSGASNAYKYVNASTYTFTGTTFSYNDTVTYAWPDSQMYGYYNISEELGTDYATLMTADMITIIVAFDAADVAGAEPWMFLYEWDDKNDDGMPNLYNDSSAAVGMGDELDRLTSASDASNVNMMTWAGDMSIENMTLVIHDPIHDVNMTATGNDFTVTLVGWDRTVDSDISFADVTPTTSTLNISLTAPDDVGIHTGFLDIGGNLWVPYAYNVVFNITDGDGAKNVVFDGFGDELEPYDNTVYGAMDEDPDDWDFRSYVLYNPYDDATYLGLRAVWDNPDNDMYLHVLDSENNDVATSSAETDTTTALLGEIDGMGYYYVLVHPLAVDGTGALPGNFTLEAMVYEELTDQPVILSYTANDVAYTSVDDGDTLTGDHVVINATYPSFDLPNMPEFEIDSMQIGFLSGVFYQGTGDLVVPDASYDPFSGPVQLDQFSFEFVPGIVEGDTVDITVDFSNGDCDIMVWWAGTDNTTWSYGNNLVADQMATGAHPEVGSFVAGQDGTLAVGVFNYDLTAGATYEVTVDTRVGVYESAAGATVTYDTYDLERNGTFQVQIVATTETNIGFEVNLAELTFENYFSPKFTSVAVTGAGAVKTIDWVVTDQNAADNHTFEVLLSADDGVSYQLIATGLDALTFDWDSTGFAIDNYTVLIRVTDSYGLTDEIESDSFEAGTVTVTTDTDTDTDTDTGLPPLPIPLLWIGLIGGIGVGVVVILILFLVKKR
jgi:hypothetical protein